MAKKMRFTKTDKVMLPVACAAVLIVALLLVDAMAERNRTLDAEHRRIAAKAQIDSLQPVLRAYDRMVDDGVDAARGYRDCAAGQIGRLNAEYDAATREIEARAAYSTRLINKLRQNVK